MRLRQTDLMTPVSRRTEYSIVNRKRETPEETLISGDAMYLADTNSPEQLAEMLLDRMRLHKSAVAEIRRLRAAVKRLSRGCR